MIKHAVERKGEFNFIYIESGIKVDFWIQDDQSVFVKSKFQRRVPKVILGQKIYFLFPEDLLLSKLLWYKESESELQRGAMESILRIT